MVVRVGSIPRAVTRRRLDVVLLAGTMTRLARSALLICLAAFIACSDATDPGLADAGCYLLQMNLVSYPVQSTSRIQLLAEWDPRDWAPPRRLTQPASPDSNLSLMGDWYLEGRDTMVVHIGRGLGATELRLTRVDDANTFLMVYPDADWRGTGTSICASAVNAYVSLKRITCGQ